MSWRASNSGRRYGSTLAIRSPGRNPRRSPASTAGRVRMIRLTSRRLSAAAASATARNVLPVPGRADPERDRVVADRVDVALLVDGLRRHLGRRGGARRRPPGSRPGIRARRAPAATASIVPGAISWPWTISSDSSWTTAAPASHRAVLAVERQHVATQEHVAVRGGPRASAGRRPRCRPARRRSTLSSSTCLRTHQPRLLSAQGLANRAPTRACRRPDRSALAITTFITCPMSLRVCSRRSRRSPR